MKWGEVINYLRNLPGKLYKLGEYRKACPLIGTPKPYDCPDILSLFAIRHYTPVSGNLNITKSVFQLTDPCQPTSFLQAHKCDDNGLPTKSKITHQRGPNQKSPINVNQISNIPSTWIKSQSPINVNQITITHQRESYHNHPSTCSTSSTHLPANGGNCGFSRDV